MKTKTKIKKAIRKIQELKDEKDKEIEIIKNKQFLYQEYPFQPKRKEKTNKNEKQRKNFRKKTHIYSLLYLIILFCLVNYQNSYSSISVKITVMLFEDEITTSAYIYGNDITCSSRARLPDKIYINGVKQSEPRIVYEFSEVDNNITLIWFDDVEDASCMFLDSEIIEADLSNFSTSALTNTKSMFNGCIYLESINFANFDTSLVTSMHKMFYNCKSLQNLDLSHFDTSKVEIMKQMFYYCHNIISLNLANFNTSLVTDMSYMFNFCTKLVSLNIDKFETSLVENMNHMFSNCTSLISLIWPVLKVLEYQQWKECSIIVYH